MKSTQECDATIEKQQPQQQKPRRRPLIYICKFDKCGKAYAKPHQLEEHERSHSGEKPYTCPQCGSGFPRVRSLQRHVALVHRSKTDDSNMIELSDNAEKDPDQAPISCSFEGCAMKFKNAQLLRQHLKLHSKPASEWKKCRHCSASFAFQRELSAHATEVHGRLPHTCPVPGCDCRFKYKCHVKSHLARKHGEETSAPFLLALRSLRNKPIAAFTSAPEVSNAGDNAPLPHVQQRYACSLCQQEFRNAEDLQEHVDFAHKKEKREQPSVKRSYVCMWPCCNRVFTRAYNLAVHKASVHLDLRPFVCAKCTRGFSTQGSLERHMRLVACVPQVPPQAQASPAAASDF